MKIPNTPFSTRLSGSAKEIELRLRSIFRWKKQDPPAVLVVLIAAMVLSCFGLVSCQTKTLSDQPHVYEVLPGSDEWNEMTPSERRASCAVSQSEVEGMTTAALLTTVLDYPYLIDMFAFNSLQAGIDAVSAQFPGLPELLDRNDARRVLKEYMETSPYDEEDYDLKWQYARTLAEYLDGEFSGAPEENGQDLVVVDTDVLQERGEYPVNSRGETYGSQGSPLAEEDPDLVLAKNTGGVLGYVRADELDGFEPETPQEAAEYMQTGPREWDVAMYLQDGETVVGTFHVGG